MANWPPHPQSCDGPLEAVEQSKRHPELGSDAIRRVYPIETALGIVGAGIVGGGAAVFRAIVGASAKQALPESRPLAGNAAANVAKPESAAGNVGKAGRADAKRSARSAAGGSARKAY